MKGIKKVLVLLFTTCIIFCSVFSFEKIEGRCAWALPWAQEVTLDVLIEVLSALGLSVGGYTFANNEYVDEYLEELSDELNNQYIGSGSLTAAILLNDVKDWINELSDSDFIDGIATFGNGAVVLDNTGESLVINFDESVIDDVVELVENVRNVDAVYSSSITRMYDSSHIAQSIDYPISNIDELTCDGMTQAIIDEGIDLENNYFFVKEAMYGYYLLYNVPFGYVFTQGNGIFTTDVRYQNQSISSYIKFDALLNFDTYYNANGLESAQNMLIQNFVDTDEYAIRRFTYKPDGYISNIANVNSSSYASSYPVPLDVPEFFFNYSRGLENNSYFMQFLSFEHLIGADTSSYTFDYNCYSELTTIDILNPDGDVVIDYPNDGIYEVVLTNDVIDLATNPEVPFYDFYKTMVGEFAESVEGMESNVGRILNWLRDILSALQDILDSIIAIPGSIISGFSTWFDSVISWLSGIYDVVVDFSLLDTLEGFYEWLFVPDSITLSDFKEYIESEFEENEGVLFYPYVVMYDIFDIFINYEQSDCILTFPSFTLNMPSLGLNNQLWDSYEVNLSSLIRDDFNIQDKIYLVNNICMIFGLLFLLRSNLRSILAN